ncbi:MAG: right-handed parallel beta-helix repeat-containing protein, partial [Gammaproteobacteria bacterium]
MFRWTKYQSDSYFAIIGVRVEDIKTWKNLFYARVSGTEPHLRCQIGTSRVAIDNCRLESNRDFGIHVMDGARVAVTNTRVNATGFREGLGVDNTPNPGIGIAFEDRSRGAVAVSTVSGSFAAGIA